jgi:hypothetical protein
MRKTVLSIMLAMGLAAQGMALGVVPANQVNKRLINPKQPAKTAVKPSAKPQKKPLNPTKPPLFKKPNPTLPKKANWSDTDSSSSSDCHYKPKDKWFVVIHENADASKVLSVPEYADFANKGTYFSNYSAITHPSQPNYIGLIAGDTFEPPFYDDDVVDFPNADRPDANSTIIDLIEAKGLSWKVYIENYPVGGTTDDFSSFVYSLGGVVWDFSVTSGPSAGDYPAGQALFGAQTGLPSATLIATPNLDGTPGLGQDFTGKIVIISRGGFPFSVKAKNAQDAGAIGVVIYNSVTGAGLFTPGDVFQPGGADPTVTIPVFGISHSAGLVIVNGITSDPTTTGELPEDLVTATNSSNAMYARKHNPFISFLNISTNPARAAKLVNADEFAKDLANDCVPDFAFYIPNQFNDGHDTAVFQLDYTSPLTESVPYYSGQAFATTIGVALAKKSFVKDRVIVLTFDEDDFADDVNQVYCAFVGENVKRHHIVSAPYSHYNLLRTIEESLGVGTLGRNDTTSMPMTGWRK